MTRDLQLAVECRRLDLTRSAHKLQPQWEMSSCQAVWVVEMAKTSQAAVGILYLIPVWLRFGYAPNAPPLRRHQRTRLLHCLLQTDAPPRRKIENKSERALLRIRRLNVCACTKFTPWSSIHLAVTDFNAFAIIWSHLITRIRKFSTKWEEKLKNFHWRED